MPDLAQMRRILWRAVENMGKASPVDAGSFEQAVRRKWLAVRCYYYLSFVRRRLLKLLHLPGLCN